MPHDCTRLCPICGEPFKPRRATGITCSRRCANTRNARNNAEASRLAQLDRGEGKTYRKYHGVHEHRVVAAIKIGRPLRKGEVVHHIDGDKRNNAPDNLEVLPSQAEHARLHSTKNRKCEVEGCERKHLKHGMCGMHFQRVAAARKKGVMP